MGLTGLVIGCLRRIDSKNHNHATMNEGKKTLKGGSAEAAAGESGESATLQGWKEGDEIIAFDRITDPDKRAKAIKFEGTFNSAQKRNPKRRKYIRANWQRLADIEAEPPVITPG